MQPSSNSDHAPAATPDTWTRLTWAYAALVVFGLAYFLVDLPVQVTDSYGNMVDATRGSLWDLVYRQFFQQGYLRPLLWAHIRVLFDVSGGAYYEWFRGWHVAQVTLLVSLFLWLVRPRGASAFAATAIGLAALVGMHTFAGTVREAFPVNTFMTILLCCFGAAAVAMGRPAWWRDPLAALILVFAALTVESGLLVAVVVVAAWLAGARGVSWRGVALQVSLIAGYLYLRFVVLAVGSPGLEERSSGFGFSRYEPDELIASFGGNPLPFYAYNVLSSIATVLFGEPRGGTFVVVRDAWLDARYFTPWSVGALATTLGTLFIVRYAWVRRREWWGLRFDRGDQLVVVFVAVTLANAVISYPYTKDVIMSPAGIFFAAALTVAVRHFLDTCHPASWLRGATAAMLVLVLSSAWAVRAVGAHLGLRVAAASQRAEWAYVDSWLEREHTTPTEPAAIALKEALQEEAAYLHPLRPPLRGDWIEWFSPE